MHELFRLCDHLLRVCAENFDERYVVVVLDQKIDDFWICALKSVFSPSTDAGLVDSRGNPPQTILDILNLPCPEKFSSLSSNTF